LARLSSKSRRYIPWGQRCLVFFGCEGELISECGYEQVRKLPGLLLDIDVDTAILCNVGFRIKSILATLYSVVPLPICWWRVCSIRRENIVEG
jgi:hypothetical protein